MKDLIEPFFRTEILYDLSWTAYLATTGMNPSRIIPGLKSMKHLKSADDPRDEKPQRNMLVGSMTHALVLESEQFDERFAVYDRGGNRGSRKYAEFCAEHPGKEIAKPDEFDQASATARAVLADPIARDLINSTKHEVTVLCEQVSIQCKGRIDALGTELIVDLKTTTNVESAAFGRVAASLNYAGKMACYQRFVAGVTGELCDVKVIAVETKPPYDVVTFSIPQGVLDSAWDEIEEKVIRKLRGAIERDEWPGVANGEEQELYVPNWARPEQLIEWSE